MTLSTLLPPEISDSLAVQSISAETIDRMVTLPEKAGVLLTGSQSEGSATLVSDVDIMVVLEDGETFEVTPVAGANLTVFPTPILTRHLLLLDGCELDFEVIGPQTLATLALAADALRRFGRVNQEKDLLVPNLQPAEARLFGRLASGRVLANAIRIEEWRERLSVRLLPQVWFVANMMSAFALIEDALTFADAGDLRTTVGVGPDDLAATAAAENILVAALAAVGHVRWDLKRLPRIVRSEREGGRELPMALQDPAKLMYPSETDRLAGRYASTVLDFAKQLIEFTGSNPEMQEAMTFLRRFGVGRWRFDASFLTDPRTRPVRR